MQHRQLGLAGFVMLAIQGQVQAIGDSTAEVDAVYARSEALYLDLHRHPELSSHELQTGAKLAAGLRDLGYEVATGVGGTGVFGALHHEFGASGHMRLQAILVDCGKG